MTEDRSHPSVARRNQRDVLGAIALSGPLSRTDLARRTGLHAASISRISKTLIAAGLVRERSEVSMPGKPGRRFIEIEIHPDGGYVVGIAINAQEQSVTLANIRNERVERTDLKIGDVTDWKVIVGQIVDSVHRMAARGGIAPGRIFGASVAVTGLVDTETGRVLNAPTLGWRNVPIRQALAEGLGIPVSLENLPSAINLAEHRFGITVGCSSVLLMNTALGVGSSLLLDGRLHRGKDGFGMLAGEAIFDLAADGTARTLNAAAGGRGVLVEAGMSLTDVDALSPEAANLRLDALIADAGRGDANALGALARAGENLGRVIAVAGSVVQPDAYVLSGPLALEPAYAAGCETVFRRHLGDPDARFWISRMTSQSAARWLAIGSCLIDNDLDLDALATQEAA